MARKIGILKEFLPALLPKYKIMLLEAFSPHDLLTAYIKNTLAGYPRLEDQNLDDLTLELLYGVFAQQDVWNCCTPLTRRQNTVSKSSLLCAWTMTTSMSWSSDVRW